MRRLRRLTALVMVAGAASVAGFGTTTSAHAQTGVATLTGETLISCHSGSVGGAGVNCANAPFPETGAGSIRVRARCASSDEGRITWTASGVAAGPYPGTFIETGAIEFEDGLVTQVEVNFHIESEAADVDGRKFMGPNEGGGFQGGGFCFTSTSEGVASFRSEAFALVRYEAIIKPVTGGSYADEGQSSVHVSGLTAEDPRLTEVEATIAFLTESFTSDLAFAKSLLPDAKEQCRDQGFLIFGVFKNQGDCVSFVTTHGKNEPGKNTK